MSGPDTGAREPQDSVSALTRALEEIADAKPEGGKGGQFAFRLQRIARDALEEYAADGAVDAAITFGMELDAAAGVGVPPPTNCGKPVTGVSTPFGRTQTHVLPCVLDAGHDGPCALARGVGVPPDENQDLVAQSAKSADVRGRAEDWVVWLGDQQGLGGVTLSEEEAWRLSRDVVALTKELDECERMGNEWGEESLANLRRAEAAEALAGVGEARPAEPPLPTIDEITGIGKVGAPAEEQPDARAVTRPVVCEHCREREATREQPVHWREPMRLCDLCYRINDLSKPASGASAPLAALPKEPDVAETREETEA